jgi:hypothetical protein
VGTRLAALQVGGTALSRVEEARVGHDLPIAGGQKPRHAQVDADRPAGGWQRHGLSLGDDDHIPAAALPLELQRLDPPDHRPMLVHLDSPDRLEAGMRPSVTAGRLPPGTVPGDKQHLVEPLTGLEAWVADPPRVPHGVAGTSEVGGEGRVEAAEGLLLGGEGVAALPIRVGGADLLELRRLVAVGDADLAQAPGLAP